MGTLIPIARRNFARAGERDREEEEEYEDIIRRWEGVNSGRRGASSDDMMRTN